MATRSSTPDPNVPIHTGNPAEVRNLIDQAKRETASLASQARDQVRDHVQGLVAERKDQMANRLGSLAGVLHDAGRRLEVEDGGGFGRYAHRAAEQVDRVSNYLRDRDLDSFVHDSATLARRRPELFLGGAFLAGVLLARFLKASSERRRGSSWDDRRYSDVHRVGPEDLTTPYGPNTHRLDGPDAHAGEEGAYGRP